MKSNILFLDNIRSLHNVGSLFRIADTVGIVEIILSETTGSPIDRFGRPVQQIAKTALGAEKTISWTHTNTPNETLKQLQKNGYEIVVLEQTEKSIDYKLYTPKKPFVFIVGNEVTGVSKEIREIADTILEIPMLGKKESLNVSVASAVALFRILHI